MNTFNLVTMRAKTTQFGGNIYYWYLKININLKLVHAHFRPRKLIKIELQAEFKR